MTVHICVYACDACMQEEKTQRNTTAHKINISTHTHTHIC